MAFTRLENTGTEKLRNMPVPPEEAFSFLVAMTPLAEGDFWVSGRHQVQQPARAGDAFLVDLTDRLAARLTPPFDFMRLYIPLETLDALAYERGLRRVGGLKSLMAQGVPDPVIHGLALALLPALRNPDQVSTLFLDQIGLAVHTHALHNYGNVSAVELTSSCTGLASWQFRRACAYIEEHLDGDPSISALAQECRLSTSHFARAFRQTAGVPPHQWLMKRRVERAKSLLLKASDASLADIAQRCGFTDTSHLSRVFSRFEGHSPGRWRRLLLDLG